MGTELFTEVIDQHNCADAVRVELSALFSINADNLTPATNNDQPTSSLSVISQGTCGHFQEMT